MTFRNYLQEKGNSQKSIETKELYVNQLKKWSKQQDKEIETLSYKDFIAYIKELQQRGLQQATIQGRVGAFKDYYHYLIKSGARADHPIGNLKVQGVQQNKLYHILEEEELAALYRNYETAAIII